MTTKRAVGIDLGTSMCAVAYIDESGHTAMLANSEGDLLTPSVVLFDDEGFSVGNEARKAGTLTPGRCAEAAKRYMACATYPIAFERVHFSPEVIQACVLCKLGDDIAQRLGPDTATIVAVPASFREPARHATVVAAEIAGLKLLDIINDPMAGALAFGEHLKSTGPMTSERAAEKVLVFDLGGGTFDVTVLDLDYPAVKTIASDGDVALGGCDWDMRLAELVSEEFASNHRKDPRGSQTSFRRLLREIEPAKRTLSVRQRTVVAVDHAGISDNIEVTRQNFEAATKDLLERVAYITRRLLDTAEVSRHQLSRVLLVGGSSRMPMVSRMLKTVLGLTPVSAVNPDEAVARGAAIFSQCLLDGADDGNSHTGICVANVNAHSLRVTETGRHEAEHNGNSVLIPRNSTLPAEGTKVFLTRHDNQKAVEFQLLEGESTSPDDTKMIGRAVVNDLPAHLPKGHPVEVTCKYMTNCRLTAKAQVLGNDREYEPEIHRMNGLPAEWIGEWHRVVAANSGLQVFKSLAKRIPLEETSGRIGTYRLLRTVSSCALRMKMGSRIRLIAVLMISSLLGLAIAYGILHWLNPTRFAMPKTMDSWFVWLSS